MDYADTVFKTIGGELLLSFEHETLNRFGIIPDDETDSFAEYSYCDTATPESVGSNLADILTRMKICGLGKEVGSENSLLHVRKNRLEAQSTFHKFSCAAV